MSAERSPLKRGVEQASHRSDRPGHGNMAIDPDSGKWQIESQGKVFELTRVDYLPGKR
ncbi:MAG: hypothetical protein ACLPRE_11965 [Limisphaerales bacterium]